MQKKIASITTLFIGLLMIIFGIILYANKPQTGLAYPQRYSAESKQYSLEDMNLLSSSGTFGITYATFGADFYTYIYRGVDEAVSALDTISSQLSQSSYADQAIYNALQSTVEADNDMYAVLADNLSATDQLAKTVYSAAVQQNEKQTQQNAIILFCAGMLILVYGINLASSSFEFKFRVKTGALSINSASVANGGIDTKD